MNDNGHALGSMVDEMSVYMVAMVVCAIALVVNTVISDPMAGVEGIVAGGVLVGSWEWWSSSWRAVIVNSTVCAQLRDGNSLIEKRSKAITRAAMRASTLYIPITAGLIVWSAEASGRALSMVQGFVAGIWLSAALLLLTGTRYFRSWEYRHGQALLRSGRRWAWSESNLEGATKTCRTVFGPRGRTPTWRLFLATKG